MTAKPPEVRYIDSIDFNRSGGIMFITSIIITCNSLQIRDVTNDVIEFPYYFSGY